MVNGWLGTGCNACARFVFGGMVKTGIQNWKTTAIGAAIAGLYALQNANELTWKHALVTFAIAAFGFVCADGKAGGSSIFKVKD